MSVFPAPITALRTLQKPSGRSLAACNIRKQFGGVLALDGVSLELQKGRIHGLIGPNGSGKTTLLNMLCGYYPTDSGEIRCGEENVAQLPVEARAQFQIARSFQTPRLLPAQTVLENVMIGAWPSVRSGFLATAFRSRAARLELDRIRDRAERILVALGLGSVLNRRASTLEHGQQRFVEIGRTLALAPDFLLLDEPAGGLADGEIHNLESVLRVARNAGIGILLVEHHTEFVFRTCDEVTVLDMGKVIYHGSTIGVQTHPEVIRVYLGSAHFATGSA